MNADGPEHIDAIDLLLKVGVFVCFVVFGLCMWVVRREWDKRKNATNQNAIPPKIPRG